MFPTNSQSSMSARRPRYRRITQKDNVTTIPDRVTFPEGAYVSNYSNPSTAVDGPLGGPYGNTPERVPYEARGPFEPLKNAFQQVGTAFGKMFTAAGVAPQKRRLGPGEWTAGIHKEAVLPPQARIAPQLTADRSQQIIHFMGETNRLPPNLSDQTIAYMQAQGLQTAELAQYYTFDAKTGTYQLNQNGQEVNKNAGAVAQGSNRGGAAPFGTNVSGQRLDASGNVWDPKTAKRDIYGGRFIQVGEKRWERNKNGRLIQVRYGRGGKKYEIGRGGRGGGSSGGSKPRPKQRTLEQEVNTNVASG